VVGDALDEARQNFLGYASGCGFMSPVSSSIAVIFASFGGALRRLSMANSQILA
jgi:hypothetical protein